MAGRQHPNGEGNKTHYNTKDDISELKLKIKKLKERLTALDERVKLGNRDTHVLARSNRLKIMAKIESEEFNGYSPLDKNELLDLAMKCLAKDMDPDLYDLVSKTEREQLKKQKKKTLSDKTRNNILTLYYMEYNLYTKAKQTRKVLQENHVGNLSEPLRYLLSREDVNDYDKNRRELINGPEQSNPEATDSRPDLEEPETKKKMNALGKKYEKWRDKLSAIYILKANISGTGVKGQKELTGGMSKIHRNEQRLAERSFLDDDNNSSFVKSLLDHNEKWGTSWVRVPEGQSENVECLHDSAKGNLQKALRSQADKLENGGSEIKLERKDFEKCKIPFLHYDVKINVDGLGMFQPNKTDVDKIIEIQNSATEDASVQPLVAVLREAFPALYTKV